MVWTDLDWRSADGLTLRARDYAGGNTARLPLLCLHGLTRNARDFEDVAPRIASTGRRTITVDVRGRGLSDRDPAADYRIQTYVADVIAMAHAFGIDRAVLLGTSMGGLITMELATQAPSLLAAAILNDIGPDIAREGLVRIAGYVGQVTPFGSWDEAAAQIARHNGHALPHYGPAEWLAMARRTHREQDGAIVADYDPRIVERFTDPPPPIDPWERWATLATRPVLVLRGAASDLLAQETADRMAASSPNVRLAIVPAVGHAPMLDEPAARAAIDAFLDEVA